MGKTSITMNTHTCKPEKQINLYPMKRKKKLPEFETEQLKGERWRGGESI